MTQGKNSPFCKGGAGVFVAGIVRNSFIDWPGKIAFVVFLGGCNFTCPHCHNNKILDTSSNTISLDDVLSEIRAQIGFIDGVVISGGEPTTHPNLYDIIQKIRELGLPIKLDTNGSNPEIVRDLVTCGLVDFVAMDIKAPFDRYIPLGFTKDQGAVDSVRKTFGFLKTHKQKGFDYMFRTTPIPELSKQDLDEVKTIAGGKFVLNDFVDVE